MNRASNLMVICQACHDQLHSGVFSVGSVQQTSHGPERVIYEATESETSDTQKKTEEPGAKKKGKWTEVELETVKSTLRMYTSLSLKSIRAYLSSTYSILISESMLSSMRKGL